MRKLKNTEYVHEDDLIASSIQVGDRVLYKADKAPLLTAKVFTVTERLDEAGDPEQDMVWISALVSVYDLQFWTRKVTEDAR